jgi:hypothetical protein
MLYVHCLSYYLPHIKKVLYYLFPFSDSVASEMHVALLYVEDFFVKWAKDVNSDTPNEVMFL